MRDAHADPDATAHRVPEQLLTATIGRVLRQLHRSDAHADTQPHGHAAADLDASREPTLRRARHTGAHRHDGVMSPACCAAEHPAAEHGRCGPTAAG